MVFLRQLIVAAMVAVLVPVLQATEPPDHQFEVLSRLADGGLGAMPGQTVEVDVDLPASSGFTVQVMGERAEARTAWPSTRSPRAGAGAPWPIPRATTTIATNFCPCGR